ncbi:LysR substrate-binding domain-containing protein [Ramlibacter sp. H39-3-26]|uniref:LysR family transcriptional regulator n=1 Tax=Curvibacter soli TaxID=3031331 RepID=UPI0023DAFDE8|nr:LysR family transcriptional regulator [Ramlibacter sp. H39-3-26]MDF1485530.1 LysR substrate-binding domain-containing protein [Ramlibacter sp. H39-3-26]
MNVSLRQLRVFQAVAQERNFSRAGTRIGLTQPAVSRTVRELESQLGVRLLDRTTREVHLTDAGRSLAARLERALEELEMALQDVRGMASGLRGRVRVASSPTLSASLMPACIAECARVYPDVQLVLLDRIQQDVLDSVRAGEVDFGVVIDPPDPADLYCERILTDPFCLVLPTAHRLARRKRIPWAALAGEKLVLLDHASGSRRLIDAALLQHHAPCEVVQEVGHPTTAFSMVEAGLGLSVLPALALPAARLQGLAVRALSPGVTRDIMLVHRRNRAPGPLAQRLWTLVAGFAHSNAPEKIAEDY